MRPAALRPETRRRIAVATVLGEPLLRSPWLRRLGGISFLGTLDHHPRARSASTRWEHSLAVAELAVLACRHLELEAQQTRTFVAAALLHDVGHFPLSHAAEPAFARQLGADHHQVGEWIVRGQGPIDVTRSLRPELERIELDADLVWAVIDQGADAGPLRALAPLLYAPINLDTLDGIYRVLRTFGLGGPRGPETRGPGAGPGAAAGVGPRGRLPRRIFGWVEGEVGIVPDALGHMDAFWAAKDMVYEQVINVPSNILAEARLCDAVAEAVTPALLDELERFDDAALAETMRRHHGPDWPGLRIDATDDQSYELRVHAGPAPVLTRRRKRYHLDPSAAPSAEGLPLSRWPRRFRHLRAAAYLVARHAQLELPGLRTRDLEAPEY